MKEAIIKGVIELVLPASSLNDETSFFVKRFTSSAFGDGKDDIYGLVEKFRETIFPELGDEDFRRAEIRKPVEIEGVVNLHDENEIMARDYLEEMLEKIRAGKEIIMDDGLPNLKVTETRREETVLFDGHHTALAYMFAGRRYLPEIPHLRVLNPVRSGFSDHKIHVFFGTHSQKLTDKNWRDYVISWNKPEEEQLKPRLRSDMGELFQAVRSVKNYD